MSDWQGTWVAPFFNGLPKPIRDKVVTSLSRRGSLVFRSLSTGDMSFLHDRALAAGVTDSVTAFAELTLTKG